MSSVEFLSLEDENAGWVEGPSMPRELMEFTLVTLPKEDGVLAIGGISGSTREAAIFKMTCTGSLQWCRNRGGQGGHWPPQYLADQLTLF